MRFVARLADFGTVISASSARRDREDRDGFITDYFRHAGTVEYVTE